MTTPEIRLQILRKAKEMLESEDENFICIAVHYAGKAMNRLEISDQIEKEISDALGAWNTLPSWLYAVTGHRLNIGSADIHTMARIAWVDRLIQNEMEKARDVHS